MGRKFQDSMLDIVQIYKMVEHVKGTISAARENDHEYDRIQKGKANGRGVPPHIIN